MEIQLSLKKTASKQYAKGHTMEENLDPKIIFLLILDIKGALSRGSLQH